MRILFADGSPDWCGHTAFPLALLTNREYEPLNLTCCTIGAYGSSFPAAGWMPPWGRRTPSLSVCRCTGTASAAASATRRLVSTTGVQNGVYSGEAVRHILDSIGDFFYAHLQEAPWPQS